MAENLCSESAHLDAAPTVLTDGDEPRCGLCGRVRQFPAPVPLTPRPRHPVTAVFDETHVMSDAALQDRVFRRGSPKTPEAAAAAFDAIVEISTRQRDADLAAEERRLRAHLTDRVREAIALNLEGHRAITHGRLFSHALAADAYRVAAEAAVEEFVAFARDGGEVPAGDG